MALPYIADNDDTNKVELDIFPTPKPLPLYKPQLTMKQKLDGTYDFFIGKPALQGSLIPCSIIQLTRANYDSICAKMDDSVYYSPDGTTKYECAFHDSTGEAAYIEGTNYVAWNIVFVIIRAV